jgi:D-tyrosyl-tRNA(Tyr) deacylase
VIAVVQRVLSAKVEASGKVVAEIGPGMVAFVAAVRTDSATAVEWMSHRLVGLRIFEDTEGKMNLDCAAAGGAFLFVSNFTVAGDTQKGRRPSFSRAASFEDGRHLFDMLIEKCRSFGANVHTGAYGEEMKVTLENDGPITLIVETTSA